MNDSWPFWMVLMLLLSGWGFSTQAQAYQEKLNGPGVLVKGHVTYKGSVPKLQPLQVNRDQQFCGKSIPDGSLLVDEDTKGISYVVVNLKEVVAGKALPENTTLKMDNRECRFQPPVSMGVIGNVLEIASADPVLHNTHILQNKETFLNVALPPGGRTIRKTLIQPGRLKARCDAHHFMQASIHIFSHPYFTGTDKRGAFELTDVPPGTYTLQFWHQTLGMKEVSITVNQSTPVVVNVSFP